MWPNTLDYTEVKLPSVLSTITGQNRPLLGLAQRGPASVTEETMFTVAFNIFFIFKVSLIKITNDNVMCWMKSDRRLGLLRFQANTYELATVP